MRSEPQCWMYTPRTISSSVRKVFSLVGQSVLRTTGGGRLLPSDKDSKGRLANQYCTDFVPFGHGAVYEGTTLESAKPRYARL